MGRRLSDTFQEQANSLSALPEEQNKIKGKLKGTEHLQEAIAHQVEHVQLRQNEAIDIIKGAIIDEEIIIRTEISQAISESMLRITEASTSAPEAAALLRMKVVCGIHRRLTELNGLPEAMRVGQGEQRTLIEQGNTLQRKNAQQIMQVLEMVRAAALPPPVVQQPVQDVPPSSLPVDRAIHRGTTSIVLQMCSLQIIIRKMGHETNQLVILDPLSMASYTRIKRLVLSLSQDHLHLVMRMVWSRSEAEVCPVIGTVAHDVMLWEGGWFRPWQFHLLDHRLS